VDIDLKAERTTSGTEFYAALAALQNELREREGRLEAKLDRFKADIMRRVLLLILGTVILNVLVIFGVVFGLVSLAGSD
jgi:hypothetical protein